MSDLRSFIESKFQAYSNALDAYDEMFTRIKSERDALRVRFDELAEHAFIADADPALLKEFLEKPYALLPISQDKYWLIVPRFLNFRGGWAVRNHGAFSVYEITRFIHFLNPLPDWLAAQVGYTAPTWKGVVEGNELVVTHGDPQEVASKLGKNVARVEGKRLHLKAANRFDVIRQIIREYGILPYAPAPVPNEYRRDASAHIATLENGEPAFTLRDYQARDYARFLELGAASIFAYGQTGKSYVVLQALAALKGPKIIFVPTRSLRDQWQMRVQMLTPDAAQEVTVATYHSIEKYRDTNWTLMVMDEAHHLPANLFIEAATLNAIARIGLSATPIREDHQEDLIPALCGQPMGFDWTVTETQRPRVHVWIVKDEAAKLATTKQLLEKEIEGKTLVFTYRLDIGERAAKMLQVPFVHGQTKKPLDVLRANDTVVVSKVGDAGLSLAVDRIVEIDFQFGSRQEAGQRLLRAAYDTGRRAEFHTLMTPREFESYSKRLLIYEQWGLEMTFHDLTDSKNENQLARRIANPRASAPRVQVSRPSTPRATVAPAREPSTREPNDEIAQTLNLPAIAAKISQVEKSVGKRTAPYIRRAFRYCWAAALSPREITEGLGITDASTRSRLNSACAALKKAGLLADAGQGRYRVNQEEVTRLRALSALRK